MNSNGVNTTHTLTALKRWSCGDEQSLPPVADIKALHVYDFDNTLFASPLPNKALWANHTWGQLQTSDIFVNGGWWHDAGLLGSTGEGLEKEEPRAWEGWWNEQIVDLVRLSMETKDALTVLLTGRAEDRFPELVKRIVSSKGLQFDMVCLKPTVGPASQTFSSTMVYKQELIRSLVNTYKEADEIRIYEDRPKHTQGFRDFLFAFNQELVADQTGAARKPIMAEVVQVPENATKLDPVTEVAQIQRMCNAHNLAVKNRTAPERAYPLQLIKNVFFTAYMIGEQDKKKLIDIAKLPNGGSDGQINTLANSILILPRACPPHILKKVGGMGKQVHWRVTGRAVFENKLWAARVEPVPATETIHSENATPLVVVALRRGARPHEANRIRNWQPVSPAESIEFMTKVDEKVQIRIEREDERPPQKRTSHDADLTGDQPPPAPYYRQPQQQWQQRGGDDRRGGGAFQNGQRNNDQRNNNNNQQRNRNDRRGQNAPNASRGGRNDRGRGAPGRGRGRGGGAGGGGGGGGSTYRSLDDMGESGHGRNNGGNPAYDY